MKEWLEDYVMSVCNCDGLSYIDSDAHDYDCPAREFLVEQGY